MRRVQRFTVNVPKRSLRGAAAIRIVDDSVAVLEVADSYDSRFGVLLDRLNVVDPESLIV